MESFTDIYKILHRLESYTDLEAVGTCRRLFYARDERSGRAGNAHQQGRLSGEAKR